MASRDLAQKIARDVQRAWESDMGERLPYTSVLNRVRQLLLQATSTKAREVREEMAVKIYDAFKAERWRTE